MSAKRPVAESGQEHAGDGGVPADFNGVAQRLWGRGQPPRGPWIPVLALLVLAGLAVLVVALRSSPPQAAPTEVPARATEAPTNVAAPTPPTTPLAPAVSTAAPAVVITGVVPIGDPLEVEISSAYREYLRVYSDALYELDVSKMQTVAVGEELERAVARIDALRRQGEAIQVNVEHVSRVVRVSGGGADVAVRDMLVDRSFAIDPVTKQPLEAEEGAGNTDVQLATGTREDILYLFGQVDGSWKVTRSFRVSP